MGMEQAKGSTYRTDQYRYELARTDQPWAKVCADDPYGIDQIWNHVRIIPLTPVVRSIGAI